MANDRYASESALENSRRTSREAKRRRTGTCVDCGAVTRYHGRGRGVSERCLSCAAALNAASKIGNGEQQAAFLGLLAEHGTLRFSEAARLMGRRPQWIGQLVHRLLRHGKIRRVSRGVYALPEDKP